MAACFPQEVPREEATHYCLVSFRRSRRARCGSERVYLSTDPLDGERDVGKEEGVSVADCVRLDTRSGEVPCTKRERERKHYEYGWGLGDLDQVFSPMTWKTKTAFLLMTGRKH